MPGEVDLNRMLATLTVNRRPDVYTMVSLGHEPDVSLSDGFEALIIEDEGVTAVATVQAAERLGLPVEFRAAWLTLAVHSSLEAVGLTAAVSRVLTDAAIACNVVAGYYHDHLLVPIDRADDAIGVLETRRAGAVD